MSTFLMSIEGISKGSFGHVAMTSLSILSVSGYRFGVQKRVFTVIDNYNQINRNKYELDNGK